jgi:hypothetical protein
LTHSVQPYTHSIRIEITVDFIQPPGEVDAVSKEQQSFCGQIDPGRLGPQNSWSAPVSCRRVFDAPYGHWLGLYALFETALTQMGLDGYIALPGDSFLGGPIYRARNPFAAVRKGW